MLISLDISKGKTAVAVLDKKRVHKTFRVDTASISSTGRIEDMDGTTMALERGLAAQSVKGDSCVFILPSSAAVIKEFKIPRIKKTEIPAMLAANLSGVMDITEDSVIDFVITDTSDGYTLESVVVSKQVLRQYSELASRLRLKCAAVDLRFNALRKYIASYADVGKGGAYLVANMAGDGAEICLCEGRSMFVKTHSLASDSGSGANDLLKNWAVSFNQTLIQESDGTMRAREAADQIQSMVRFQAARDAARPVGAIYLSGDLPENMGEAVAESLGRQAGMLAPDERLPYCCAMGAAVKTGGDLDLLHRAELSSKGLSVGAKVGIAAAAVVFCGLAAAGYLWYEDSMARLTQEVFSYETVISGEESVQKLERLEDTQAELALYQDYTDTLRAYDAIFQEQFRLDSSFMNGIYSLMEQYGAQMSSFSFSDMSVNITALCPNEGSAAEFAKLLEQKGLLTDVNFSSYSRNMSINEGYYTFYVTGRVAE